MASLSPFARTTVSDMAGVEGYEEGILRLVVRTDPARTRVRDALGPVDFSAFLAGFRNVQVRVGQEGRIGREARADELAQRRVDARKAAEEHPQVRRLLAVFGARIDAVEPLDPLPPPPEDDVEAEEDAS